MTRALAILVLGAITLGLVASAGCISKRASQPSAARAASAIAR